jgi:hypothetical protein
MTEILLDCRAKEALEVLKKGGDVWLVFKDRKTKKAKFYFAVELKKKTPKGYQEFLKKIDVWIRLCNSRWEVKLI